MARIARCFALCALLAASSGCAVGEVSVQPLDSAVALDGQLVSADVQVGGRDAALGSAADATPVPSGGDAAVDGARADADASGASGDTSTADGAAGVDGAAGADAAPAADGASDGARADAAIAADGSVDGAAAAGDGSVDSSADSSADGGPAGDSSVDTSHDSAPPADGSVDTSHDSSVDSGGSVVPGAACPCSSALLCVLGACRQLCEPPSGVCNVDSSCPASQACVPTTTGVHVCVPAGNIGSPCSGSSFCPNGSVCGTFGGQALCRRTCSAPGAACVGGGTCVAVNGGCAFCL